MRHVLRHTALVPLVLRHLPQYIAAMSTPTSPDDDEFAGFSILTVMSCGKITPEDDHAFIMQGVSLNMARQISKWLVAATGEKAELRWMTIGRLEMIVTTPEELARTLQRIRDDAAG